MVAPAVQKPNTVFYKGNFMQDYLDVCPIETMQKTTEKVSVQDYLDVCPIETVQKTTEKVSAQNDRQVWRHKEIAYILK